MARKATGQVIERKRKRSRTFALRFHAYGERHYETLGSSVEGWTRPKAEQELQNRLADVRRGIWRPPTPEPAIELEPDPTFHEFASEWFEGKRHELAESTAENYRWALHHHLLPFFARHRLTAITVAEVDRYRNAKLREREQGLGQLSNNSINETITRLAQILEVALEYGHIERNAASGRARRLKGEPRRRASMEAEQIRTLLDVAGRHRALLATAIMAGGLRNSEVTGLRWRDVDLASGRLAVAKSKTEAGMRVVDLSPQLRDELAAHKADARDPQPDDYVFPGRPGKKKQDCRRDRGAVLRRILRPAIERANVVLEKKGRPTISPRVTFHSLRRSYASLMAEAGADPAYTAAQIGHKSARFTLDVYTDVGHRRNTANARLDVLISGDEKAPKGTSGGFDGDETFAELERPRPDSAVPSEK